MTHHFWEETITRFRCPALKVELLRDNPLGIDLSGVLRVVRDKTEYDPELIRRHLLRLKAKHLLPPTKAELRYPSGAGR
jgi:lipopolysaccharide biosynthesis protein